MEFPDVYDWICRTCQWKEGSVEQPELEVFADYAYSLLLRAKPYEGKMSLTFHILQGGTSIGKYEIGRYEIGNCSEESMQNNLLPLLLWLFFDPFTQRSSKVVSEDFSKYLDMFRTLKLEAGIIEPTNYKLVFNSLIFAGCSFFSNYKKDEGVFEILAQTQQKTLSLIGPEGTPRFMGFLALTLNVFSFLSSSVCPSWKQWIFERVSRISDNSSIGGSWTITSYSPLFSLKTTNKYLGVREWANPRRVTKRKIRWALRNNLLHYFLRFQPVVNVCPNWIEVCLQLDNVRCDVLGLEKIVGKRCIHSTYMNMIRDFQNEGLFPAKISLTIGPENGLDFPSVSLGVSSPNPITDIGKENTFETQFQTPNAIGVKTTASTTTTKRIKSWGFEQSVVDNIRAKIVWTLYDATGKAVFDNGPPKFSVWKPQTRSIDKYFKACRPFTEDGGVVFAKDDYGNPIKWKFNKNLEGKTLKWDIKGSIWLTYWPNAPTIRYFETKCHEFHQVVDLTLPRSSSSTPN